MKGLELARGFYEICRPQLYESMPQVMAQACAGLCGEGSECFGCDDDLSQDHDFSAAFCLWLPEEELTANRELVDDAFRRLPKTYQNISADFGSPGLSRRGPLSIEQFFKFFTALRHPPKSWQEWLTIPEAQLAAVTNGEIFDDNAGIFSAWRRDLRYYPEDVRLKKMAARVMQMAQSGQYNLPRCLQRGEFAAACLALGKYAEASLAFVYLANRQYMPFYKWAPRLAKNLPVLGQELNFLLNQIAAIPLKSPEHRKLLEAVESFCSLCARWLNHNDLSDSRDSWLWPHGPQIIRRVKEPEIQRTNLLRDGL